MLMEQGVYLQLKYLSCGEKYYCKRERWRREAEEMGNKKESEYVCMKKKRMKCQSKENTKMDLGYVVNNTCRYGSLRKRGFFSLKVFSGVNSMVKLLKSEELQLWFLYFR